MQIQAHPYAVYTIHENAKTLKCRVATAELAVDMAWDFLTDPDTQEVWVTQDGSRVVTRLLPGLLPTTFYTNLDLGTPNDTIRRCP